MHVFDLQRLVIPGPFSSMPSVHVHVEENHLNVWNKAATGMSLHQLAWCKLPRPQTQACSRVAALQEQHTASHQAETKVHLGLAELAASGGMQVLVALKECSTPAALHEFSVVQELLQGADCPVCWHRSHAEGHQHLVSHAWQQSDFNQG